MEIQGANSDNNNVNMRVIVHVLQLSWTVGKRKTWMAHVKFLLLERFFLNI